MSNGPPNRPGALLLGTLTKAEYLKLRKKWDAKLNKEGFNDVERIDRNGVSHLNRYGSAETSSIQIGYGHEPENCTVRIPHPLLSEAADIYESRLGYVTRCAHFLESASRRRP